ncbi:MAG: hypothetical protein IKU30_04140 [Clostridia bacterium]|nr:hypothetical protein [Clostridia bacterium]
MIEIIEKQIKNVKKSCVIYGLFSLPFAPWPIAIVLNLCITGIGNKDKITAAAVTFTVFGIIASAFLTLFFKRFSLYRKLKASRGKDVETFEIDCAEVKLVTEARTKNNRSVTITGLTLIGADGKKYYFPLPKRIEEYNETITKPLHSGADFFKTRLKGKRLHIKCYKDTSIIHEIKELPNYEIAKIDSFTTRA